MKYIIAAVLLLSGFAHAEKTTDYYCTRDNPGSCQPGDLLHTPFYDAIKCGNFSEPLIVSNLKDEVICSYFGKERTQGW